MPCSVHHVVGFNVDSSFAVGKIELPLLDCPSDRLLWLTIIDDVVDEYGCAGADYFGNIFAFVLGVDYLHGYADGHFFLAFLPPKIGGNRGDVSMVAFGGNGKNPVFYFAYIDHADITPILWNFEFLPRTNQIGVRYSILIRIINLSPAAPISVFFFGDTP